MRTLCRAATRSSASFHRRDLPVGTAEESNRQEHSEQAKPRKRSSSTHTTLRVIPFLKLVCDRALYFPPRAWFDSQLESAAASAVSEKECSKPPANGECPAGLPFSCIVFGMLREDRATWTSGNSRASGGPVPPRWWFSARGVGDHVLAQTLAPGIRDESAGRSSRELT